MQYLNLTEGFNPFHAAENLLLCERFRFPGGEQHIKLKDPKPGQPVTITGRFHWADDVMALLLAVDALKRSGITDIQVFIPYLPYARQDRVMVPGEPLSVSVFANLINGCGFSKVSVFDPHSDVSGALLHHFHLITNASFIKSVLSLRPGIHICCPDAGAEKKIYSLCQQIGYQKDIIFGRKHRDVATGKLLQADIINTQVPDEVMIADDICDGGGTFTLLAKSIKNINPACRVSLAVSHGIFSRGLSIEGIDHVYTTDSFQTLPQSDDVTQFPLSL